MVSGSGLADSLIAVLKAQSASLFQTANISKNDFGILDTTPGASAYIVLPGPFTEDLASFGNPARQIPTYILQVKAFLKDDGNPVTTINRVWQSELDIRGTLLADDTLSGSVMTAQLKRGGGWNGDTFVESGGNTWIPVDYEVEIMTIG